MRSPSGSLLLWTSTRDPIFEVVKEICSFPITISSSCLPTRSGSGHWLSSSFSIWTRTPVYQIIRPDDSKPKKKKKLIESLTNPNSNRVGKKTNRSKPYRPIKITNKTQINLKEIRRKRECQRDG